MPSPNDLREARAELQKMQAEMADDKAFGMFSPALQRRITETKKLLATMTVEVGKLKDAERALAKQQRETAEQETKANRMRIAAIGVLIAGYAKATRAMDGLKQAGMANTVEANQQQIAYTLLGREIAAVFLPATKASTNVMMAATKAMNGLTEEGQNVVLVISYATAGLVTFTAAQIAATAAGLKFTGVLAVVSRWLPLIGLAGGAVVALGAIFLSSESGAAMLNRTLEDTVDLLNDIGKKAETMKRMTWTEWLGAKGFELLESVGILKKGVADFVVNKVGDVQEREGRGKRKNKPREVTPGQFRFESSSADAFERVQVAAAKSVMGEKDIPAAQLRVQEEQLEVQKQMRDNAIGQGGGGGGADF